MMMKKHFAKTVLISSLFFLLSASYAETFRVRAVTPVDISDLFTEVHAEAGINDAILISLPKDMTYISGIELHFKIPEIVASWRDTIAYSIYDDLSPRPSAKNIDYSGTRITVGTFPGRLSHTIYIPLTEGMELKDSPYHEKIAVIPNTKERVIFFRMQLAMKGVPEAFENATFECTAKPVLISKGKLNLTITEPKSASNPYSVVIDAKPVTLEKDGILLGLGEHHLSITSENYRNEVRTFRIEQAKSTSLTVNLRGINPLLKIASPENARVSLDGNAVENTKNAFEISPGEHTVRFVIGDYEVVRTVTAVNGRTYNVNLSIDATVSEEE
ncbi:MAG: PEGA domain-containing protein [Treponema sp.]|nr:PEGA domain-containing protein [Treponema sp.]